MLRDRWRRVGPVEHCPTCEERAELLLRGRRACSMPEHDTALRSLGYWRGQALEYGLLLAEAHAEIARLKDAG